MSHRVSTPLHPAAEEDSGTRARVRELVIELGPVQASSIAERLDLTPAAVRRHLTALVDAGEVCERAAVRAAPRGRGRPPRNTLRRGARNSTYPMTPRSWRGRHCGRSRAAPGRLASRSSRGSGCANPRSGMPRHWRRWGSPRRPERPPWRTCSLGTATPHRFARSRSCPNGLPWCSCARDTARSVRSRRSFPNCARLRRRCCSGCSGSTCSDWPPSPAAPRLHHAHPRPPARDSPTDPTQAPESRDA